MPIQTGVQQFVKLEQRLTLLAWLNDLFGYAHNRDLLADVKEVAEGFDASGRSFVYHHFLARGDKVQIAPADLARYDDHIRAHLQAMNARRPEPITLRYSRTWRRSTRRSSSTAIPAARLGCCVP